MKNLYRITDKNGITLCAQAARDEVQALDFAVMYGVKGARYAEFVRNIDTTQQHHHHKRTTTMTNAHNQAVAQLDTITALVAAYNADFDRLTELRDEREDLATDAEQAAKDYDALAKDHVASATVAEHADRLKEAMRLIREWDIENLDELQELEEQADGYECREDVEQAMQEHPLSLEYRSGWALPGQEMELAEFRLVLCTGGPHVEIVGDLDANRVRVLYEDWGESGELHGFDADAVETYLNVIGVDAC